MFIIMGVGNYLLYATESKSIGNNNNIQHCIELSFESALNKLIKLKIKVNNTQIRTVVSMCAYINLFIYIKFKNCCGSCHQMKHSIKFML